MNVLITGAEGYIGSRMAPWLMAHGHHVVGLDTGYYRDGRLYEDTDAPFAVTRMIRKDLRHVRPIDFDDIDAVVHLAELSNDPLGENCPDVTFEINHRGSVRLAACACRAGVKRLIYASSCSVYGHANDNYVDETSIVRPQTAYAECKVLVENDLRAMADSEFSVVILRNATAYGPSPHMRFDIVLNDLCARAWTTSRIELTSDGSPWRPLVHIEDICEAVHCALEAPTDRVNTEVYNIGATAENYRIRDIALIVCDEFPGCQITYGPSNGDQRSYRVNFNKVAAQLPGFQTQWTARHGAQELHQLFRRIDLSPETFSSRAFTRLKQIQYLQESGLVDSQLYWTAKA